MEIQRKTGDEEVTKLLATTYQALIKRLTAASGSKDDDCLSPTGKEPAV